MLKIPGVKKLFAIAGNSALVLLPGVVNVSLSIWVVRYYGEAWWGSIVELQLAYYFISTIISWGNKEFILREMSLNPASIATIWFENMSSRFYFLLLPSLFLLPFIFDLTHALFLMVWLFTRFVGQSYESLMVFEKKFTPSVVSDLLGLVIMFALLFFPPVEVTFNYLLLVISAGYLVRLPVLYYSFRMPLLPGKPYFRNLSGSWLFLMLSLTGLAGSKIDLFMVDILLPKSKLGEYHIISNFLLLLRSGSNFLIYPFVKGVYRLSPSGIRKYSLRLLVAGIAIWFAGTLFIIAALDLVYGMKGIYNWVIPGIVTVIPCFWFTPFIYYFFRMNKQGWVVVLNVILTAATSILCWLLIPGATLTGAYWAIGTGQIVMAAGSFILFRRLTVGERFTE